MQRRNFTTRTRACGSALSGDERTPRTAAPCVRRPPWFARDLTEAPVGASSLIQSLCSARLARAIALTGVRGALLFLVAPIVQRRPGGAGFSRRLAFRIDGHCLGR